MSQPKAHPTRTGLYTFVLAEAQLLVRILRLTDPPAEIQEAIRQKTQEFARRGFRTLGKPSAILFMTLIDVYSRASKVWHLRRITMHGNSSAYSPCLFPPFLLLYCCPSALINMQV
jgi:hypothetical protein